MRDEEGNKVDGMILIALNSSSWRSGADAVAPALRSSFEMVVLHALSEMAQASLKTRSRFSGWMQLR